jgi:hypothetical protein
MQTWLRLVVDTILGRVPGKTSRLDTATRMAMDANFTDRDKPRSSESPRNGERDDKHLVKAMALSEDIALFEEIVRIVNGAQGRDAEDERRLYSPIPFPRRSLSKSGPLDPGVRF